MLSCWPMTKVQTAYRLSRKLDDNDLEHFGRIHRTYGVFSAKVSPTLDQLLIEWDAARLTSDQLEALLKQLGLPIITTA